MKTSPHRISAVRRLAAFFVAVGLPACLWADANVIFLKGGPLTGADDNPIVVGGAQVGFYTTGIAVPYDGNSVEVTREEPDPELGFLPATNAVVNLVLPGVPADYTVSLNQLTSRLSAHYMGDVGVADPLEVIIAPAGGIFYHAQFLKLTATPGTTIRYSIDGGPFVVYSEPFPIADTVSVDYYGTNGPTTGPTKTAVYTYAGADCEDLNGNKFPSFVDILLGLDPVTATGDVNDNGVDDFEEVIRGGDLAGPALPPAFVDTDMDGWPDADEILRGTDPNDPDDFPVAPNLQTVEILREGTISETAAGGSPPPLVPPGAPFPTEWNLNVYTPAGLLAPASKELTSADFDYRAAGHRFHYAIVRAKDGTGRILVRVEPPHGLCIDPVAACPETKTLAAWRTAYRAEYDANIYFNPQDSEIDPRTTAEAFLLNRYYELGDPSGGPFAPGVEAFQVPEETVLALRALRNEAELYRQIQDAVTPEMIDLVGDFFHFRVEPFGRQMSVILADLFAGRPVNPGEIPDGVRIDNIAAVAAQTSAFFAAVGDGTTVLTGAVTVDSSGFLITPEGGDPYRLINMTETIAPGSTMSIRALVDIDDCGFIPRPASVVEILGRNISALAPGIDSDGDGLPDEWEYYYFGHLNYGPNDDPDGDGQTNMEEYENHTNPSKFNDPPATPTPTPSPTPTVTPTPDPIIYVVPFILNLETVTPPDFNNDGFIDISDYIHALTD